ncbi:MAG: L-ribulose-5-phosphate 3-epimerase [Anaerolineae bacterium]
MDATLSVPIGLYEKALPADWPWEKRLEEAARAGYNFVEISIDESEGRLTRLDWPARERAALRQAIANTGVPVMSMCLSGHRKYPLGSHSPETRAQGLTILHKAIEFAGDIGLRIVQVMGYDVFYETSDAQTEACFMAGIEQGVRWASQAGVMLGLENLDTPFVASVRQAMRIVKTLDSPWFHLYPDMGNLAAAGYHPPDELALAKGHLLALHVKDARPKIIRGIPFGEGIVPFVETFKTLARLNFCGPLAVELWGSMDHTGDLQSTAVTARQFIERLIAQTWVNRPAIIMNSEL